MADNYEVIQVFLESVPYNLLIYKIPEEELNDKLTYFTREKGLIPQSLFHDFLIANCISNIHDFLEHLQTNRPELDKLVSIREEMVDKVMELNPSLIPSNLIINTNKVVKVKEGQKKDNEILLTENELWKNDLYKDNLNIATDNNKKELDLSKVKNVQDLGYSLTEKFWRRIGRYVSFKKFEPGSEVVILGDRSFNTRTAFEQYVVTICVEEVEDLFLQLDKLGLPNRVSPHILIHELYEICRNINPFLDYDNYKDTMDPDEFNDMAEDDQAIDPFEAIQGAGATPQDILSKKLKDKKRTKLFRDVPKEKLLKLGDSIKKHVIGQDQAIDDLMDAIQRASVGLKDPDRPIGSFIFTGYTGVGKTYTAKILAEQLIGSRRNVVSVDCSEYSADHEYAKLIGAPSGYIGHEHGGFLTNALKRDPFSIVLFDEIEKASDKVHQLLLQVMDEARLTDGKGNSVSFRDAIVIMTSNLGVNELQNIAKTIGFGNVSEITNEKRNSALKAALKKKFKPEFINRISCIVNFNELTKKDYLRIIKLEIEKLKRNLRLNRTPYSKLDIKFDRTLYNFIYKTGIDSKFGARPLQRAIEKEISTPLARELLRADFDVKTTKVIVKSYKGKVKIEMEKREPKAEDPPFYMEAGSNE